MIRVMLRIPLDNTYMTIKVKASSPVKVMQSLEGIIREMENKDANEFWAKEFGFRFNKTKFIAPGEKIIVVEETIIKGEKTPTIHSPGFEDYKPPAPIDATDRYNYLNQKGHPYQCNKCQGLISWDKYPSVNLPIHVDEDGKPIGDGSCPNF